MKVFRFTKKQIYSFIGAILIIIYFENLHTNGSSYSSSGGGISSLVKFRRCYNSGKSRLNKVLLNTLFLLCYRIIL